MSESIGAISLDLTLNNKIEEQLNKLTKSIAGKFSGTVEKSFSKPFENMRKVAEQTDKKIEKPFENMKKSADSTADSVKESFESSYTDIENAVNKCVTRIQKEQDKLKDSVPAANADADTNPSKTSATAIPAPSTEALDKYISKAEEKAEKLAESFRASTNPIELLNQKLDVTYAKIGDAQREADELFAKYNEVANAKGADSDDAVEIDKAFTVAQEKLIRLQEQASRTESKLNEAVSESGQSVNKTASASATAVKSSANSAGSVVKNKLTAPINQSVSQAKKLSNAFGKVKSAIAKVGNAGKTAFSKLRSHLKSTDKSAKTTHGLFSKLGKTVKSVFKATFITAALYAGFRALKSLFSDAMEQSENFQKSLNSLKGNFKIAFQPIISTVLPILTKLMNKLSQVMATVASFISGIFGTTYEKSKEAAKQASQTAKKSSEEAQKYLNSYDVMNKAQDTSSDGSSSEDDDSIDFDSINTQGSKAAETLGAKFKKVMSDLFEPIKGAWAKHGQPVMDSIKNTAGKIKTLFVDMGKDFKAVWTDGTGENLVSSILKYVKSIVDTIGKIAGAFDRAWNKGNKGKKMIKSILTSATKFYNMLTAISDSIGTAFESPSGEKFFENILGIITNISNFVGNLAGQFTAAWSNAGLGNQIMTHLLDLVNSITGFVERITSSLATWAGELDFTPLLENLDSLLVGFTSLTDAIGGTLGDAFEQVLLPLASWTIEDSGPAALDTLSTLLDGLGTIIDTIRPGLLYFYEKVLKPIGSWAGSVIIEALGKLKTLFGTVAGVFKDKGSQIHNIISGISDVVSKMWEYVKPTLNTIKNFVFGIFDNVVSTIKGALSGIIDALSGIIDFIKDVFKGDWKAAWNDVKKIVKGVWNAIYSVIKGIINNIIEGINLMWKGIYRAISGIVNAVGKVAGAIGDLFGKDWHFEMPDEPPTIPKLAGGGLATAPTLAMVGDNRNAKTDPEVISPLSKLKGMIDDSSSNSEIIALLEEILDFLKGMRLTFLGELDGDVLYKHIVELNQSNTNRTGVNALT